MEQIREMPSRSGLDLLFNSVAWRRGLWSLDEWDDDRAEADPEGYKLAVYRANIQFGFMEFISAVSFVSCITLIYLIFRSNNRRKITPYDKIVAIMAFFQGLDQFSYFLNYSPTSVQYTQDDDKVHNLTYSYMWIHRFSHAVSMGGDSLLGASILFIFWWGKSPRIDRLLVPWFGFYFVAGICFASTCLGLQMHYRNMSKHSEESKNRYEAWRISLQSYTVFSWLNIFFDVFVVVLSLSIMAVNRQSSHCAMMKELVRRFALYPLALVFTQFPYIWVSFHGDYYTNDDDAWTEMDRLRDGLYNCLPQMMGFLLLLIYLLSKRISICPSGIAGSLCSRALLLFLRKPQEGAEEVPPDYSSLQDGELVDIYVEQVQAQRLGSVFVVNTNPIRQSSGDQQQSENNQNTEDEHLQRRSSAFAVGNPLRLGAPERSVANPAADVEMAEQSITHIDEVPSPS